MIAFTGTTSERNTIVSRTNDSASTSRMINGVYVSEMAKKSVTNAVSPPTSTALVPSSCRASSPNTSVR